jgi:hypothetical protein
MNAKTNNSGSPFDQAASATAAAQRKTGTERQGQECRRAVAERRLQPTGATGQSTGSRESPVRAA